MVFGVAVGKMSDEGRQILLVAAPVPAMFTNL
jgi:hypothetical protein